MRSHDGKSTTRAGRSTAGTDVISRLAAWIEALRTSRAPRVTARPAPRAPRGLALRAPRPRWWSSFWAARLAVRSGIGPEDFLRHRLTLHLASLPVPASRLPVALSVEEGGALACGPAGAPPRRSPWLESFLRAEGAARLGPGIELAQADAARLAGRIEEQRRRVAEAAREVEEATGGADIADPADDTQASQMGRPPSPFPLGLALQLFALALLLAEAWQLTVPCLETAGIRTRDISAELERNPVGVVLGSILALGAAVALFVLAHLALHRVLDALEARAEAGRRPWASAGAAGAAVLAAAMAAAMAWSIAGARPNADRPVDASHTRLTLFLVLLAVPLATAWLVRVAHRLEQARAASVALARSWDQAHYRSFAGVSRRAAALEEEERRLAALEGERAATLRRLRALQERVAEAERLATDAADLELQQLERVAQGIAAAVELDRYEYVRQATARGTTSWRDGLTPTPSAPARPGRSDVRDLGLAS